MVQQSLRSSEIFQAESWELAYQAFTNINFSSFSYTTIKAALLTYIQQNYPESFLDYTEGSEFMIIIDLLSYIAETLAYRGELNARDNFIDTAERKESILRLTKMLNYNMHRNFCASGLVKLTSVTTTQNIIDSNGNNLSNTIILWNDSSNPDWYEQFILVMNASFIATNQFGTPVKSLVYNNIPTQLYQFNNITGLSAADSFSIPISGQAMDFNIVNPDIDSTLGFIEQNPDQNVAKHIIYMNDGGGNASVNTGFFYLFKQGSLRFEDYQLDLPIENREIPITSNNINDTDVWVQQVDTNGNSVSDWSKVDAFENIVFNSINTTIRNIFSVLTQDNDQVIIRFSDGRLGNIPTGGFRVWYRQSNGLTYTIQPLDMRNVVISIPYTANSNAANLQSYTLTTSFSLLQAVNNSSATEDINSAKTRASRVFYTQNRMVNNQDYNNFPLSLGQQIVKMTAINRTYSGHSQFIDILDPTKNYSSTIEFGNDGAIYEEQYDYSTFEPLPTVKSASDILQSDISPILLDSDYKNFYYAENPQFPLTSLYWGQVNATTASSTGFFTNISLTPQIVGPTGSSNNIYISSGSLVQFINPSVSTDIIWALVTSVNGTGINFSSNGDGAIVLDKVIPNGWIVNSVYVQFRNTILPSETAPIITQLQSNTSFGIRYDLPTASWQIITNTNLNINGSFNLTYAGDNTNTNKDASWVILATYATTGWTFTIRYFRYFFESINISRFFFSTYGTKAVNLATNTFNYDLVTILQFNTMPNSSYPLGANYQFQLTKPVKYLDGFIEPRRVQISPIDVTQNGAYDDPDEFIEVVAPNPAETSSYVFQQQFTDSLGFNYYQIIDPSLLTLFATETTLLAEVSWINGEVVFVASTQQFFEYIDGTISPITANISTNEFTLENHGLSTGEKVVLFIGPPPSPPPGLILPDPLLPSVIYYAYVIDANTFQLCVSLANAITTIPTVITLTANAIGTISLLIEITQSLQYKAFLGRQNLNYSYQHYATQDERLDPSITNVIDMFILTNTYYNNVITWKNAGAIGIFPPAPTSFQLGQQFASLQTYKMLSDELIFQPAKFKLLFGNGSEAQLQANFLVVKAFGSTVTDNEIAQMVISTIDNYFDITSDRFDFGETAYITELLAYVHQQLSTLISTIVIVPTYEQSQFGDLFQITCDTDELFLSTATVANVQIVSSLTNSVLRIPS